MDRERVLVDQTVIVERDKIVAMGAQLPVPPDAQVIDGHKTAYLSPGLADMHTHSETRNDLAIYLAASVTTILQMGDARAGFVDTIVPAVNRGAIPGPHTYIGFLVDGSTDYNGFVIKTPADDLFRLRAVTLRNVRLFRHLCLFQRLRAEAPR